MPFGAFLEAKTRLREVTRLIRLHHPAGINGAFCALTGPSYFYLLSLNTRPSLKQTGHRQVAGRLQQKLLLSAINFFPIYYRSATG